MRAREITGRDKEKSNVTVLLLSHFANGMDKI